MSDERKETRLRSQGLAWAIIIALCAVILAWGYANYVYIPDRPRQWNFGEVPDTPGQSIYSSSQPSAQATTQLAPLPKLPPTSQEAK